MKTLTDLRQLKQEIVPAYRPRQKALELTELQDDQYRLLVYGLRSLTPYQRKVHRPEAIKRIVYQHEKATAIINRMRQQKMNIYLSRVLHKAFGGELCGNAVDFLLEPLTCNNFEVKLTQCSIDKETLISEFIKCKLLPKDFLKP